MFFKQETLNSNKEKYFVKTIGSKLIYGSTTVIANLICTKLSLQVALICLFSGLTERKLPKQCTVSAEIYVDKEHKIKPLFHCTYKRITFVMILPLT